MNLTDGFETFLRENEPLGPYTRLRLGGVAEYFAEPTSVEELRSVVARFHEANMPVRLIGSGTNLLVRDEGVPGLVVSLAAPAFCQIESSDNQLIVGGGARLSHLVSVGVASGFSGIENLVGIPGTVGGALHTNAGNQHAAIGDWVVSATVVTRKGELAVREESDINFGFRQSSLNELAIIGATLQFELENLEALTRRMQKLWIVKRSNEPPITENSAYVFHDVGGESAGKFVEQAGLRGTRIGGAEISTRNANFICAGNEATSSDVIRLIELMEQQVSDRLDVQLRRSIVVW